MRLHFFRFFFIFATFFRLLSDKFAIAFDKNASFGRKQNSDWNLQTKFRLEFSRSVPTAICFSVSVQIFCETFLQTIYFIFQTVRIKHFNKQFILFSNSSYKTFLRNWWYFGKTKCQYTKYLNMYKMHLNYIEYHFHN